MRINKIELKNFKRFTDLTIQNIPDTAKLVLLIGANGSGKSSVFDALGFAENDTRSENLEYLGHLEYYRKNKKSPFQILIKDFENEIYSLEIDEISPKGESKSTLSKNSFFGRTSFRHIPRLTQTRVNNQYQSDKENLRFFIDKDNTFEKDIEVISERILKEVFRTNTTSYQIQREYIDPVNNAFRRIFGTKSATNLILLEIIPPLDDKIAQINFRKGESEIHYNLLSAGEKEITNILFDLLVQREQYNDSVYFIDELDLHLNTTLQYSLIKEIIEHWIPENCQLWTASHSLGFIDYARKSEQAAIIDLDNLDFDTIQVIEPEPKDNLDVYEIAIPKDIISSVLADKKLVVAENKNSALFNLALGEKSYLFLPANNNREVFLTAILHQI